MLSAASKEVDAAMSSVEKAVQEKNQVGAAFAVPFIEAALLYPTLETVLTQFLLPIVIMALAVWMKKNKKHLLDRRFKEGS
ncbi:hypothetical protein BA724_02785 [Domibacillus iocasae]|uniref:Uncharacterized protein n=2 Tax=Domibacillus iocasae TaxID=1714016 RepID=A0A1E7DST5_9BACI|nr:hypothetical protein BA724_02785 [Domibacillus iocasae]